MESTHFWRQQISLEFFVSFNGNFTGSFLSLSDHNIIPNVNDGLPELTIICQLIQFTSVQILKIIEILLMLTEIMDIFCQIFL